MERRIRKLARRPRPTTISPAQSVVLYPTFGHLVDEGRAWRIPVFGAIYEPGNVTLPRRLMLGLLRKAMDVTPEALESDIFRTRIGAFLTDTERGQRVALSAGSLAFSLRRKTRRDGHFHGQLRISVIEAARLEANGAIRHGWLDFCVLTPDEDERVFPGRAVLLPPQGLSIVSDIDDTIKHTEVGCRRSLLTNTFLREFQSVTGMAERYHLWADQGAAFHYVSSSPWQLYEPLAELQRRTGFPLGSFHLRAFRLRNHMLQRMLMIRQHGKAAAIRRLLRTFPQRRFVLVGDSGEHDPELYGEIARRFPNQVGAVFIREVAGRAWTRARAARAFRRLPRSLWRSFQEAHELPQVLGDSVRIR